MSDGSKQSAPYRIRDARPGDAEQLIAFVKQLAEEPGVPVPLRAGEFQVTVEEERRTIEGYAAADNSVLLVAEADRQIIGVLNVHGGKRQATRHAGTLGVSVRWDWRGRGVGTALMARAIAWARDTGVIKRLELHVYCRNAAAIALYEKFGFVTEGRRRNAVFTDGQGEDDLIMALLL